MTFDAINFAQMRLDAIRAERVVLLRQLGEHVERASASYVAARAHDLAQNDAVDRELTMLLRAAHGMTLNGPWPHPKGTCVYCGAKTGGDDVRECEGYTCKQRPECQS